MDANSRLKAIWYTLELFYDIRYDIVAGLALNLHNFGSYRIKHI